MSLLSWGHHRPDRADATQRGPTALALHAWGSTARADFADSGFAAGLADRGVATLACDLPGHGDACEIALPDDAEPAAWTAGLVAADVVARTRSPLVVVGHRDGALTAAHLAVRGELDVAAVVLVGCDGERALPLGPSAARQVAEPTATVWDPEVSTVLADLRRAGPHHPATLARWLEAATWPATPRLGALRVPVLVVADAAVPRQREHAPVWAAWFHDASVATVGAAAHVLGADALHAAVADLVRSSGEAAGGSEPAPHAEGGA